jgi:uncharacterized membrane protein (UPF0127 family)
MRAPSAGLGPTATEAERFRDLPRVSLLGLTVPVAVGVRSRRLGLAHLNGALAGEGLLIPRCKVVHTFGMRFPLDLVWLDTRQRVLEVSRSVPPRRIACCARAAAVLELPSDDGAGVERA